MTSRTAGASTDHERLRQTVASGAMTMHRPRLARAHAGARGRADL